jgi:hypothetical protein
MVRGIFILFVILMVVLVYSARFQQPATDKSGPGVVGDRHSQDWNLVVPPVAGYPPEMGVELSAPLSDWEVRETFSDAKLCEQAVRQLKLRAGNGPLYGGPSIGRTQLFASRCVSSDLISRH